MDAEVSANSDVWRLDEATLPSRIEEIDASVKVEARLIAVSVLDGGSELDSEVSS